MASGILNGPGSITAAGIFFPYMHQGEGHGGSVSGSDSPHLGKLADFFGETDEVALSDLAQTLQEAGGSVDGGNGNDLIPIQLIGNSGDVINIFVAADFAQDIPDELLHGGFPHADHAESPMPSGDGLDLLALDDLNEDDLFADIGEHRPRVRRIDHLIDLERREFHLGRILEKINELEDKGEKLVRRAEENKEAGAHLENGVTPSVLNDRADEIAETSTHRARARVRKAKVMERQAEELLDLGGRKNRIRAKLKLAIAKSLRNSARTIRKAGMEKAEGLRESADTVADALDRLGLTEDSPKSELRRAGRHLQKRAVKEERLGNLMLRRAERLREFIERILDKVRGGLHHHRGHVGLGLGVEIEA